MKPRNIFVLRHGQSIGNVDWRVYRVIKDHEIPLTELGGRQALTAGIKVSEAKGKFKIYSSNYLRAIQTADFIAQQLSDRVVGRRIDNDLRELKWMDFGKEGSLTEKLEMDQREHMKRFLSKNEGGESAQDVYFRMGNVINRLGKEFESLTYPENAVIVSHGIAIRCFMMKFLDWPTDTYESLQNPHNCQVFHLQLDQDNDRYDLVTPFPRLIFSR